LPPKVRPSARARRIRPGFVAPCLAPLCLAALQFIEALILAPHGLAQFFKMPLKFAASHCESFDLAGQRAAGRRLSPLNLRALQPAGIGSPLLLRPLLWSGALATAALVKFLLAALHHSALRFAEIALARFGAPALLTDAFRPVCAFVGISHKKVRPPHFPGDHLGDVRVACRGQLVAYAIDRRLARHRRAGQQHHRNTCNPNCTLVCHCRSPCHST